MIKKQKVPLAARMRPRNLDEFIGQSHILGSGRLLRRAIQADQLSSLLFYGPPGTGKTTLAQIIAQTTESHFISINAVLAGIKEIREAIEKAQSVQVAQGQKTILFVDEVHRFNKTQQDALLPHVENGTLILIGATTENPYFEVNKALVSRSRIFQLKSLEEKDIAAILEAALIDSERGYGKVKIFLDKDATAHLIRSANGDARNGLNALELAVETTPPSEDGVIRIDLAIAEESIQKRAVVYDKNGDAHYDTISAFIKSVRGSDPDAALYWMAKMIYAGEEPRFIFRRMLILAAEDIGLADPHALSVVNAAAQAFEYVGLPEGQYHLTEACLYLATAAKSNTTKSFFEALKTVEALSEDEVPNPLRDKSREGKELSHIQKYAYPHDFKNHWVAQQYLPDSLVGKEFYQPSTSGYEGTIRSEVIAHRLLLRERNQLEENAKPKLWDEILRCLPIQADSLVLELSGGRSPFLNALLPITTKSGVWVRLDDASVLDWMQGQFQKKSLLEKPYFLVSDVNSMDQALSEAVHTKNDKPQFDFMLGVNVLSKITAPELWLQSMQNFAMTNCILLLAEINQNRSQSFSDLILTGDFDPSLKEKIQNWEVAWREANLETAIISHWNGLDSKQNGKVTVQEKDFFISKHFTSQQIHEWFTPEIKNRSTSFLSHLATKLTTEEKQILENALQKLFQRPIENWKQSYDFVIIKFHSNAS